MEQKITSITVIFHTKIREAIIIEYTLNIFKLCRVLLKNFETCGASSSFNIGRYGDLTYFDNRVSPINYVNIHIWQASTFNIRQKLLLDLFCQILLILMVRLSFLNIINMNCYFSHKTIPFNVQYHKRKFKYKLKNMGINFWQILTII